MPNETEQASLTMPTTGVTSGVETIEDETSIDKPVDLSTALAEDPVSIAPVNYQETPYIDRNQRPGRVMDNLERAIHFDTLQDHYRWWERRNELQQQAQTVQELYAKVAPVQNPDGTYTFDPQTVLQFEESIYGPGPGPSVTGQLKNGAGIPQAVMMQMSEEEQNELIQNPQSWALKNGFKYAYDATVQAALNGLPAAARAFAGKAYLLWNGEYPDDPTFNGWLDDWVPTAGTPAADAAREIFKLIYINAGIYAALTKAGWFAPSAAAATAVAAARGTQIASGLRVMGQEAVSGAATLVLAFQETEPNLFTAMQALGVDNQYVAFMAGSDDDTYLESAFKNAIAGALEVPLAHLGLAGIKQAVDATVGLAKSFRKTRKASEAAATAVDLDQQFWSPYLDAAKISLTDPNAPRVFLNYKDTVNYLKAELADSVEDITKLSDNDLMAIINNRIAHGDLLRFGNTIVNLKHFDEDGIRPFIKVLAENSQKRDTDTFSVERWAAITANTQDADLGDISRILASGGGFQGFDSYETDILRNFIVALYKQFELTMQKAASAYQPGGAGRPKDEDIIAARRLLAVADMVFSDIRRSATGHARALNVMRKLADGESMGDIAKVIEQFGGADTNEEWIANLSAMVAQKGFAGFERAALKGASSASNTSRFNQWMYSSMLSQLATAARNFFGGAGFIPIRLLDSAVAKQYDRFFGSGSAEEILWASELFEGMMNSYKLILSSAAKTFKTGEEWRGIAGRWGPTGVHYFDSPAYLIAEQQSWANPAKYFNLFLHGMSVAAGRPLRAGDTLLKEAGFRATMNAVAHREVRRMARAAQEGRDLTEWRQWIPDLQDGQVPTADQLDRLYVKLLEEPPERLYDEAVKEGRLWAFERDEGKRLKQIDRMTRFRYTVPGTSQTIQPLRILMPFVRIVGNLQWERSRHSVLGSMVVEEFRNAVAKNDPDQIARIVNGWMLTMLGFGLAANGKLWGTLEFGYTDDEINALRRGQVRPFSFQGPGGQVYSYSGLDPWSRFFASGALLYEITTKWDREAADLDVDIKKLLSAIAFASLQIPLESSLFAGVAQFLEAIGEPEYKGEYTVENIQRMFMSPGLLRQFVPFFSETTDKGEIILRDRSLDWEQIAPLLSGKFPVAPDILDALIPAGALINGIPYLSNFNTARYDDWGRLMTAPMWHDNKYIHSLIQLGMPLRQSGSAQGFADFDLWSINSDRYRDSSALWKNTPQRNAVAMSPLRESIQGNLNPDPAAPAPSSINLREHRVEGNRLRQLIGQKPSFWLKPDEIEIDLADANPEVLSGGEIIIQSGLGGDFPMKVKIANLSFPEKFPAAEVAEGDPEARAKIEENFAIPKEALIDFIEKAKQTPGVHLVVRPFWWDDSGAMVANVKFGGEGVTKEWVTNTLFERFSEGNYFPLRTGGNRQNITEIDEAVLQKWALGDLAKLLVIADRARYGNFVDVPDQIRARTLADEAVWRNNLGNELINKYGDRSLLETMNTLKNPRATQGRNPELTPENGPELYDLHTMLWHGVEDQYGRGTRIISEDEERRVINQIASDYRTAAKYIMLFEFPWMQRHLASAPPPVPLDPMSIPSTAN